ncbi:SCO family protein [Brevundimonas sp.]|uniref:SCO family protein n=1 Tax=Brevundimonas sp. TaxID=1871086 RepID=UPI00391C6F71
MPRKSILLFAGACIAIAAALAVVTVVVVGGRQQSEAVSTGQADVGGPFQLVDQTGQAVDESMLDGQWTAVFFGFTHCPDYCPTTLQSLKAAKAAMGERGDDLEIVFISVDPERDTPELLGDYLLTNSFPEGVTGLTGTPEQVAQAARAYRAYFEKVGDGPGYTMNHTLTVYLMGPDGQFRRALTHDLAPDNAASVILNAMERG